MSDPSIFIPLSSDPLFSVGAEEMDRVRTTISSILIGGFISVGLYGFGINQVYRYYFKFENDARSIRILVPLVSVIATLQTVVHVLAAYSYMVTNFANPTTLFRAVWVINVLTTVAALGAIVTEGFFGLRVALMSWRLKIIASVVGLLMGVRLAALNQTAEIATDEFIAQALLTYTDKSWGIMVTCTSAVLVDAILFGSVFTMMWRKRGECQGKFSTMDLIAMYAVNSGLSILVVDTLALIFVIAWPDELHWVNANLVATKMAMNTMLCAINSRQIFKTGEIGFFEEDTANHEVKSCANRLASDQRLDIPKRSGGTGPAKIDLKLT